MAEEQTFALLDEDGVVTNVIVADQAFIDSLREQIDDPDVDTGDLTFADARDVTGKNVGIGYLRLTNGKFTVPPPPEPTQDELDAQAAAEAAVAERLADDARIAQLRAKVGPGKPGLTQAERDELNLILVTRSVSGV